MEHFQRRLWLCLVFGVISVTWNAGVMVHARRGFGEGNQDWGYVMVRPHAHMFYWLYYTTAKVTHYTDRPLIIWLQGGPGMPSSGYGNFIEIGPLTLDQEPRPTTWVKDFNVVFVDNPVGVGYSYISDNNAKLVENNQEIGEDLVRFLKSFLQNFDEFQTVPLYIFGESYGGKMAVEFAIQLDKEIQNRNIRANLKGIGLGDSYISPIDYILNYAPIALNLGLTDKHGYKSIEMLAKQIQVAIEKGDFEEASEIENKITVAVIEATRGIDIYNIMLESNTTSIPKFITYQDTCNFFMNTVVKDSLNISKNIDWSYINDDIYHSLHKDLIRPVTNTVEAILNNTNIKVIVYNGVFDFIVNTAGTVNWLDKLNWHGQERWQNASLEALEINMINEGYVKRVDSLVFYTVLRAGHSIPVDNTIGMAEILNRELLNT